MKHIELIAILAAAAAVLGSAQLAAADTTTPVEDLALVEEVPVQVPAEGVNGRQWYHGHHHHGHHHHGHHHHGHHHHGHHHHGHHHHGDHHGRSVSGAAPYGAVQAPVVILADNR
ncbi:hypothetical protein WME98_00980 [Sorangium sp. So ce296]|uniref:hypothetical protein n=1 Tax=Sorangium sp. So ce296 TaxID=3133296 RepID=UPI003F60BE5C